MAAGHTSSVSSQWQKLNRRPRWLALGVFVVGLTVYVVTLAPGLLWRGGDFAVFQTWAYTGQGIKGGVFGHPLWVILARPFMLLPIRDAAYRANLASAVFGALALVFVFLSARLLTRSTGAALLGTAALLVSHTFWTYSVMAKVYSLNALLLALCIYLILQWGRQLRSRYLHGFALIYAISMLNHLVMATAAAGFAVYILLIALRHRTTALVRRQVTVALVVFAVGLVPYFLVSASTGYTETTAGVIGAFLSGLVTVITAPLVLILGVALGGALLLYQFPITVLAGMVGIRSIGKQDRSVAVLLLLIALGDVAFMLAAADPRAGGVYVWNLHYYLQLYVVCALWIALGFANLQPRLWQTRFRQAATIALTVLTPIALYIIAPIVVRSFLANVPSFREIRDRDNITYVLSPWKQNETGPRTLTNAIFATLPANSAIFADYGIWAMLNYCQVVEHTRPDVSVVELTTSDFEGQLPLILRYKNKSDLYLADVGPYYDMRAIRQDFNVVLDGPIYHLIPK